MFKFSKMDSLAIEFFEMNPSNKEWLDNISRLVSKHRYTNYGSNEMFRNPDVLTRSFINYFMTKGHKLTSYKLYREGRASFYSLFRNFNEELNENYPLYDLYYSYSKKNLINFHDVNFIIKNIMLILEAAFTVKITIVNVRRKKVNTPTKNISINYITPHKRLQLVIRAIAIFSKSFSFEKSSNQLAFGILNTFLSNKNSVIYQKKVFSYSKLIHLKKLN
jgi:hypothetical protein